MRDTLKKIIAALALAACGIALAQNAHGWRFDHRPFKGHYSIYGGELGDAVAPTRSDKKRRLALIFSQSHPRFSPVFRCPRGVQ